MKFLNIVDAAFVKGQWQVMLEKIWYRLFDRRNSLKSEDLNTWLQQNESSMENFCQALDSQLWEEVKIDSEKIEADANSALQKTEHDLGGGGAYPLINFLVRYSKPDVVVETGVAAGFSSYSILSALEKNGAGRLYSSDFPYFRLPNPESFIGIVVPEKLKSRWELFIKGDKYNIPEICKQVKKVDILHYDSDKSYSGRVFVTDKIKSKMTSEAWFIMDDIQDNSFFYDYVSRNSTFDWKVFQFGGKWVGIVCPVKK